MRNGLFSAFLIFFSCLDARKEAKEDQGVRDAGQFGLVHDVYLICFLFFVFRLSSFLALMQEKKQKKIKPSAEGGEVWLGTCLGGRMLLRPYIS